jgi:hypothetical protein
LSFFFTIKHLEYPFKSRFLGLSQRWIGCFPMFSRENWQLAPAGSLMIRWGSAKVFFFQSQSDLPSGKLT